MSLVQVDEQIASLAERMWRHYRQKDLKIPDALIAATAIARNLTLVTFNQKHFRYIPELSLFPIDTL